MKANKFCAWLSTFILCFLFWMLLVWSVAPRELILGAVIAAIVAAFTSKFLIHDQAFYLFNPVRLAILIFYLVITGFIGAFKAYSDAVALFGTNLNAAEMNTIVGYIYDMLYGDSGGYPSYAGAPRL